jgi:hypothetical protein
MRISRTTQSFILLSLVLGAASLCSAAPITYDVDQTVHAGRVTGFIETDGTSGVIGTSNILDFNLLLNDGTTTVDDLRSNSVFEVVGSDLTATATQLLFNFGASDPSFVIFELGGFVGANFWCATTGSFTNACDSADAVGEEVLQVRGPLLTSPLSGTQVIASVGPAASTPEPSTLALLAAGIALLGFRKSKHRERRSY